MGRKRIIKQFLYILTDGKEIYGFKAMTLSQGIFYRKDQVNNLTGWKAPNDANWERISDKEVNTESLIIGD